MKKREFLRFLGAFGASAAIFGCGPAKTSAQTTDKMSGSAKPTDPPFQPKKLRSGPFELAPLPYAFDALEPHFDRQTMEIHHDRHHKAYVDNLNKNVGESRFKNWELADIFSQINADDPAAIRNNAGGHWNHDFFWQSLRPATTGAAQPSGELQNAIRVAFGSSEKMQEQFSAAAKSVFGSGWAWLCKDEKGMLYITSTPNQDNPLMKKLAKQPGQPILGLDVWEHAYYLKHQNKRADYVAAFWNIVDWAKVGERFAA